MAAVLGVDRAAGSWVGVVVAGQRVTGVMAATGGELVSQAMAVAPVSVVAIDIPIGLPDTGRRAADLLAKRGLGPRSSSLFLTPVRAAVEADSYSDALAVSQRLGGAGISRQAYGLRAAILDVERWLPARPAGLAVIEVHPELSFAAMSGGQPLRATKRTWAGVVRRRTLLRREGIRLPDDLGAAGRAGVDDVLDASAAAWTALRYAEGRAQLMPDPPEVFSDGWPAAIWT